MGEIFNLRRARKRAARKDAERKADENRALHGASKAERSQRRAEAEALDRTLDGARLSGDAPAAGETLRR